MELVKRFALKGIMPVILQLQIYEFSIFVQ